MPTKYNIQELDLSSRRSLDIEAIDESFVTARYFYHAGQFWRARIPLNHVQAIYGQAFNFSGYRKRKRADGDELLRDRRGNPVPKFGFVNHVQCRFRMERNHTIKLYALENQDCQGEPAAEISDFVYSIEAVGPPGVLFDFRNGLAGNLMCAHRFLSTEEMVFERVVVLGYYVRESPPLPIDAEERKTLLVKSLQRSDRAGLDETYYLYRCCGTNNCTSNPFAIIDSSVRYRWWQKLASMLYRFPLNPRFYLRIRGLDSDPGYLAIVRDEFSEFINKSETKKRKRRGGTGRDPKTPGGSGRGYSADHAILGKSNRAS